MVIACPISALLCLSMLMKGRLKSPWSWGDVNLAVFRQLVQILQKAAFARC